MRHPRRRIIDIALPDADVRDEQYLDGTMTFIPHVVSDTFPTPTPTFPALSPPKQLSTFQLASHANRSPQVVPGVLILTIEPALSPTASHTPSSVCSRREN